MAFYFYVLIIDLILLISRDKAGLISFINKKSSDAIYIGLEARIKAVAMLRLIS